MYKYHPIKISFAIGITITIAIAFTRKLAIAFTITFTPPLTSKKEWGVQRDRQYYTPYL